VVEALNFQWFKKLRDPYHIWNKWWGLEGFVTGTSYNPPVKRKVKSSQNQDLQRERFLE
jgi:hypothetical protein